MQGIWLGLMVLTSLLLLLPTSHFTHTWHMASEQFNSANDDSPVWEAYRVSLSRPLSLSHVDAGCTLALSRWALALETLLACKQS